MSLRTVLPDTADIVRAAIARKWSGRPRSPLVVGICGAQGSGKSTLSDKLAAELDSDGLTTAVLSIDDLYHTKAERERLARDVHPLLRTRGVPGTHDIPLGLATLHGIDAGQAIRLPRFDKARDDRSPAETWPTAPAPIDIVLFEGWCVGALPQPPAALAVPVNALEASEDSDGSWRSFVNEALAGPYQALFARIDMLAMLRAPDFSIVQGWRLEQEHALRAVSPAGSAGVMDDHQVIRFIAHYERLTRHILAEMPNRANLVIDLDEKRNATRFTERQTDWNSTE